MKTNRRTFIKKSGFALGSATLLSHLNLGLTGCSNKLSKSFGFQVWTIRE